MDERRQFERFDRNLVAFYRKMDSDAFDLASLTRDVSVSGLLIELGESFEIGDTLGLDLVLSEEERHLRLVARVVRMSGKEAGLEFVHISDKDRTRIEEYVKKRHMKGCA